MGGAWAGFLVRRGRRGRHPLPGKQHHAGVAGRPALVVVELRDQEFDRLSPEQIVALIDSGDRARQISGPAKGGDLQLFPLANRTHARGG